MYRIENFSLKSVLDNAYGQWNDAAQKYDINYSSILTILIQVAGHTCQRYASDLFIDWYEIETRLHERAFKSSKYLFGFREDGVDHNAYVLCRDTMEVYDELYLLIIEADGEEMTMRLGKVIC